MGGASFGRLVVFWGGVERRGQGDAGWHWQGGYFGHGRSAAVRLCWSSPCRAGQRMLVVQPKV
jgi:hypothetical protein